MGRWRAKERCMLNESIKYIFDGPIAVLDNSVGLRVICHGEGVFHSPCLEKGMPFVQREF